MTEIQKEITALIEEFSGRLQMLIHKSLLVALTSELETESEEKPEQPVEVSNIRLQSDQEIKDEITAFIKNNKGCLGKEIKQLFAESLTNGSLPEHRYDRIMQDLQKEKAIWGEGITHQRRYSIVVPMSSGLRPKIVECIKANPGLTSMQIRREIGYKATEDTFNRFHLPALVRDGHLMKETIRGRDVFFLRK